MRRFFYILFCLIIINSVYAESKFSLCAYVDKKSGETLGFFQSWAIEKTGSDIFIYYKSENPLQAVYKVKIERLENRIDTNYILVNEMEIKPKYADSSWMAKRYTFYHPGIYKFTLLDSTATQTIATYETSIRYLDTEYANDTSIDTWYYKNVKLNFCDSVWSEILIRKNDRFLNGNNFMAYLSHDDEKQLKCHKINAKIFLLNGDKSLKDTKEFPLNYSQRWTILPFNISEKGKYIIELYNDNNIFIQSKTVDIY